MGCQVLTHEKIDLLLNGTLPAADRPLLLAHLSQPCEDCLDTLAGPAGEQLLARVAQDGLSAAESERIFAAAAPTAACTTAQQGRRASHWARRAMAATAIATSAVAASVAIVWSLKPSSETSPVVREKGGSAAVANAELVVLAAEPGNPRSLRIVPPLGNVGPREVLLFRVRLGAPAYVRLVALRQDQAPLDLWPEGSSELHGAGEFEIASAGHALSFDVRRFGIGAPLGPRNTPGPRQFSKIVPFTVRFAAIASAQPLTAAGAAQLIHGLDFTRQTKEGLPEVAFGPAEVTIEGGEEP